jgi:Ran GTPase-activating protein (RanGAP) involved in mRNA processing and transport
MDDFQANLGMIRNVDPTLTVLDLTSKNIQDEGVATLVEALTALVENTNLKNIKLGDNNIQDAGTKDLAVLLKSNKSITKLDLSANEIGLSGAQALANALEKNKSLTELDLWKSEIGPF